jgi:hypothetical protein
MKRIVFPILLLLLTLVVPTICLVKSIQFKQQCSGYLKQAADANTAELALVRLDNALVYIESHNLTDGYTSVLWKTEDENIGFWYQNIKACQDELRDCLDGTQLEKSNVLMKVRESLTDEGENGTVLTIPAGISRYPYNALWGALRLIGYILMAVSFVWFFAILYDEGVM